MLFADFGRGPSSLGAVYDATESHIAGYLTAPGYPWMIGERWCGSTYQHARKMEARRWWLVECESAAAGRRCSAASGGFGCQDCGQSAPGPNLATCGPCSCGCAVWRGWGRILDSGIATSPNTHGGSP